MVGRHHCCCLAVEGLSNLAKNSLASFKGASRAGNSIAEDTAAAMVTAVFVTVFGMQAADHRHPTLSPSR